MENTSLSSRLKFLATAGVGLFADGYLNLSIGLGKLLISANGILEPYSHLLIVVPMLGYIYFKDNKNSMSVKNSDEIKGSLSLGMIAGQLGFGLLGDAIGRHNVYGRELIITIFGTLLCILLPWKGLSHTGVVAWMSAFRVLTGFGIGGGELKAGIQCN
jgi:PHS family inorganic phosphate transporter-like MFS transporter